jgi:uncharacterized SAM-binding protein YcdF (DUF218 family)
LKIWRFLSRGALFICAFLGLLLLLATYSPFVTWYAKWLSGPWFAPREGTLIVLSGADRNGLPEENTVLRCMYAAEIYREGAFRKVIVTGRAVSPHMKSLLVAEGVPAEVVVTEESAQSTRENAVNVARMLANDPGPKALLTSDFHMFRAVRVFRKTGLDVVPRPIPDALKRAGNRYKAWSAFLDEATETVKILYYRRRGWI